MMQLTQLEALTFTTAQKILGQEVTTGINELDSSQRILATKYCTKVEPVNTSSDIHEEKERVCLCYSFNDGSALLGI